METNDSTVTSEQQAAGTDILDFDSAKVDRSMPMLPEQLWDMVINEFTLHNNPTKGTSSVKIVLHTTVEARSTQGQVLNPGFPVFQYVGITPSEKRTVAQIQRDLVGVLDAIYGKNTNEKLLPMERHIGKIVQIKSKNETEGDFTGTKVKTWLPAKLAV